MHRIAEHAADLQLRIITCDQHGGRRFDAEAGLDVRRVGPKNAWRASVAALNLVAPPEARRFRPELVLSGHIVTSPAAYTIARTLGVPFAQYLYSDEIRHRPRLTSFAVRRAKATLAISAHTADLARRAGAPAKALFRAPVGVDLPAEVVRRPAERPTFVTVARLEQRYKGHDVLIRALPLIRERVPDVEWIVAGDGSLRRELEQLVSDTGVQDSVRFLGRVSDEQRDALLDSAHVFSMPSREPPGGSGGEGFGIACLEASAHGIPVVAGKAGGVPDAVIDGQTGVLVDDPGDPQAVGDAIAELLLDPERTEALGRAGVEFARSLAWPLVVRRIEEILFSVAQPTDGVATSR
jgi:phosphatidylinositol alpha-1,6-mannosyltransferase